MMINLVFLLFIVLFTIHRPHKVELHSFDLIAKSNRAFFDASSIETLVNHEHLTESLVFTQANLSFYQIGEFLTQNQNIYTHFYANILGNQLSKHKHCSFLPLNRTQVYDLIETNATALLSNVKLSFCDFKFPFLDAKSVNWIFFNKNYCLAYNKHMLGIGFDTLDPMCPFNNDSVCLLTLELYGVSVSTSLPLIGENISDSSFSNQIIFDGLREQKIDFSNQFSMQFNLRVPLLNQSNPHENFATYIPLHNPSNANSSTSGYHFR